MILAFGVIVAYILFSVFHIFATGYAASWMKKEKEKDTESCVDNSNLPEVVIIIPALREVSLVEDTLDYFSKLKYAKEKYKIIFVTTVIERIAKKDNINRIAGFYKRISLNNTPEEIGKCCEGLFPRSYLKDVEAIIGSDKTDREKLEDIYTLYDSVPTTGEAIRKTIEQNKEKYGNYYVVECPVAGTEAGKPTQLNYVTEHLAEIIGQYAQNRLLIGVYDFDSRPDLRTLLYIARKEQESKRAGIRLADFYQQTQLPYKNVGDIDRLSKSKSLMKANVIMYTRRALGIEIFKILRYRRHLQKGRFRLSRPVINCLGAGMFVEKETLKEIGGFVEPVEDLVLGYQLNVKSKNVEPIPYINIMQPYLFMKEMINSHSRIFMIGLRLYREGKYSNSVKRQSVIPAVKEFTECMMWLLCCPLLWTAFIVCFAKGYILSSLILFLCVILLRFWTDFIMLIKETERQIRDYEGIECNIKLSFWQKVVMMMLTPFLGIVRFVSAAVGVGKYVYFYVFHKKMYRKKTER